MATGRKTGGGSRKGVPNKSTADVKVLAGKYTDAAMRELGRLALNAESEPARVAAIKELFDRAYGKAQAAMTVSGPDGGPIRTKPDLTGLTDEQLELLARIAR